MTQEDKHLLLQDLCARLPYGVIVQETFQDAQRDIPVWDCGPHYIKDHPDKVKPYLFPLSSMTEEQTKIYLKLESMCILSSTDKIGPKIEFFDWLNRNHFDYRGLIGKGLAIDATNLKIY